MNAAGWLLATVLGIVALLPNEGVAADTLKIQGTISPAVWQAYAGRFLDPSGRIIDDANGSISHSEGQGYGLILALAADDRSSFERIWSFTQTQMLLRSDGLSVWSWRPSEPHVPDINNASDGDLLIAYALAMAGRAWQMPRYTAAATAIATALGKTSIVTAGDNTLLLPGVEGFKADTRADGPVINLSYWVFEAMPVMQQLVPGGDWQKLARSGLDLIAASRFGQSELPTDWISLHDSTPRPAAGFDPDFGYNAIRIPLYLVRAGITDPAWLGPFAAAWRGGQTRGLPLINVETNQPAATLAEPGYRMLPALLDCVSNGTPIPPDLKIFTPTHYYPATLYLLAVSYLAERKPQCL
ncbi:endoglucanase [Kaistia soli DSM 19436]|uniref:cellulase n=1 Tax=Kaistia soli DSM 19436 TaxID=1122133 RepID=A0A1M5ALW2_9HYPH|nr:glycosyl hydrolase family 8 [Kaistia soli]SHF31165.1 endoglucanase [Kaistia soli DSM 19436]